MHQLKTILEVIYSVGDIDKVKNFFCDYGGLSAVGVFKTNASVLKFWNLKEEATADEVLIQFNKHSSGKLRLVKFNNVSQEIIRSSQKPWDTGGIMDINLRVPEVAKTFNEIRDLGWHGLSDPLLQTMGPFKLYDILMQGYDDIIVAFTHRVEPSLELPEGYKIPSHIYNSSLTVKSLEESRDFYENQLGFILLNEYEVKKEEAVENMFGIPMNMITDVTCKANIFSLDGTRDVMFQLCEFEGVDGKDFSNLAIPPNKGLLLYRCEVENIESYYTNLLKKEVKIYRELQEIIIEPYGSVKCFALPSPDGVWWEFLEKTN
ncbi:glyoxalase/bleomycin resistance protein/dioxygenase superfamily protein [Maribacter vaceletii]|uniref:Glyoxalase/bleomycin resistance protein/dioxygenase superfamily protein n=1 Tax=Maribacter vaceletii TaxID=1206816 RepID=A0A495EGZ5_9FLAO|nr:VOC family protein [Maribacter vaceletii]RKR15237.1 glyoxalase/bleomycin resistance protein/dioxygenase superfamily protein [Maribacter vaceletii]